MRPGDETHRLCGHFATQGHRCCAQDYPSCGPDDIPTHLRGTHPAGVTATCQGRICTGAPTGTISNSSSIALLDSATQPSVQSS